MGVTRLEWNHSVRIFKVNDKKESDKVASFGRETEPNLLHRAFIRVYSTSHYTD